MLFLKFKGWVDPILNWIGGLLFGCLPTIFVGRQFFDALFLLMCLQNRVCHVNFVHLLHNISLIFWPHIFCVYIYFPYVFLIEGHDCIQQKVLLLCNMFMKAPCFVNIFLSFTKWMIIFILTHAFFFMPVWAKIKFSLLG